MIRTQRWTPDTCANPAIGDACSLIEEWDDQIPVQARTHNFVKAEKLCSRHQAAHGSDHAAAFTANYEENRRKNTAIAVAQSVKSSITADHVTWSFRADGVLLMDYGGNLTANQKGQMKAACDVQFGPNKVLVS